MNFQKHPSTQGHTRPAPPAASVVGMELLIRAATLLFILTYAAMASVRADDIGADTSAYIKYFSDVRNGEDAGLRNLEPAFFALTKLITLQPHHEVFLFLITSAICLMITGGLSPGKNYKVLFSAWIAFPFFYSLSLNVLRQGLAFGILFYFLLLMRPSRSARLLTTLACSLFHYAALPFALLAQIAQTVQNSRWIVTFWIISASLAALGVFDKLPIVVGHYYDFGSAGYYAEYVLGAQVEYKTGFRLDFTLFSLVGVGMSWALLRGKFRSLCVIGKISRKDLAHAFFLFNGFAYFFVALPYSDRFFAWSWYLYPALLAALPQGRRQRISTAIFLAAVGTFASINHLQPSLAEQLNPLR